MLTPSQRGYHGEMWGVMVRPWCWEVAGPWTVAAWFTTPAVPPHRTSRWCSHCGSCLPLGSRELVPPRYILPGGTESALPLPLFSNLRYICDSCEKRTCKLISEETIWDEERDTDTWGNFLWVTLVKFSSEIHTRDSGSLYPTPLYRAGIRPPNNPLLQFWCLFSPQLQQHPLCKFYNHDTAMRNVCVYVQWRGI